MNIFILFLLSVVSARAEKIFTSNCFHEHSCGTVMKGIRIVCPPGIPPCLASGNNGFGILDGQRVAVESEGTFFYGRVLKSFYNGQVEIRKEDGQRKVVEASSVANLSPSNCLNIASDFCVSYFSERIAPDGTRVKGTIKGLFEATGELLLEENGKLLRAKREQVNTKKSNAILGVAGPPVQPGSAIMACGEANLETMKTLEARRKKGDPLTVCDHMRAVPRLETESINPLKACRDQNRKGRYLKADSKGFLLPECEPGVLYAWEPEFSAHLWHSAAGRSKWKTSFGTTLFFSRTPAATFGYGSLDEKGGLLRKIEVRKGVRFRILPTNEQPECTSFSKADQENLIMIRESSDSLELPRNVAGYSYEDFVICSPQVIQAWSQGTRDIYEELVRDLRFALNPASRLQWAGYKYYRIKKAGPFEPQLVNYSSDLHPFTQEQLRASLETALSLAVSGRGARYVNPKGADAGLAPKLWFQK